MPALLIRMSMAPNRSSVAATAAWRISGTVRSPGVTIAPGPPAARSFSGERAISESRAPRFRKAAAQAAPIPSEAPVMRTTFPSMRIAPARLHSRLSIAGTGLRRNNGSMSTRLLTRLPLHIFEDRYKEMVGNALRENSEFGIVLAREDGIVNAGCTVIVEKVLNNYPDGKMDILTCGRRRFDVVMLDEEKDYLRGEVQFFDDDDADEPTPLEAQHAALTQYKSLLESGVLRPPTPEPNLDDPQLSFQRAQGLPDLDFLNALLRTRSEAQRTRGLSGFLSQYVPRQRHITRVRQVAPRNGFGGKPSGV